MARAFERYTDEELSALMRHDRAMSAEIFQEVYDRCSTRVYAYSLRITNSREDAFDILQETFIRLYRVLCESEITSISAYALRTARNLCLNLLRDRKHFEILPDEIRAEPMVQAFEQKDLLSLIARSLQHLDVELREAFILRYYQNAEYQEMALITGESVNTMRNRVWRSKERLKVILAPYIDDINTQFKE